MPARIALEQQRWQEAADVAAERPERFPWQKFPAMEAISRISRSLGAARSSQNARASEELQRLVELEKDSKGASAYRGKQLAVMQRSALEASSEEHAATPGEAVPAQELLGDKLMELDRPTEAYQAYAAVLVRGPGRLESLYDARRTAEEQGNKALARNHYRDLVTMVGNNSSSPRIENARAALRGDLT